MYPPPPCKGGITITVDDFWCLQEEQFLNDVLIDFYLKYLHVSTVSEESRERAHIFSTFFYRRLTAKPKGGAVNTDIPGPKRRHDRVKSWTKSVDIFSKDFLFVPVNEKSHWYLAIVCFPGLVGEPIAPPKEAVCEKRSKRKKRSKSAQVLGEEEWSDRDEATEEEYITSDEDSKDGDDKNYLPGISSPPRRSSAESTSGKKPCIIIMDSLTGEYSMFFYSIFCGRLNPDYIWKFCRFLEVSGSSWKPCL